MEDLDKTKEQLINELERIRRRVSELEESEALLKGTERLLRESEERYRDLVENIEDLICTHDLQGNLLFVNEAPAKVLGYIPADMVGTNLRFYLAPEVRHQFDAYLTAIQKDGHARGLMLVQTKSGDKRIWEYRNTLRTEGPGGPFVRGLARDISDRKKAEEELKVRDSAIMTSLNGISFANPDGTISYVNNAFAKMWGFQEHRDALGLRISDFCDNEEALRAFAEFQERGYYSGEIRARKKDGTPFDIQMSANSVFDDNGKPLVLMASFVDITDRKKAEKALLESEQRYGAFLNSTSDLAFLKDEALRYVMVNKANQEFFGKTEAEIIGKTDFDLMPLDAAENCRRTDTEALSYNGIVISEEEGGGRVYETKKFAVKLEDGRMAVGGLIRDITERKKSEEALRDSEERFKQVAENAGEWIWEVDANGMYRYCSSAVEKILGYSPDELVGQKHFYDLFAPEVREDLKEAALARFERRESIRNLVNPNVHKNGEIIILETSGSPVQDERGTLLGYRGTDTDITDRKQAEEALRASEDRFRTMVDWTYDWEYWFDPLGRIIYMSPSSERVTGFVPKEFTDDPGLLSRIVHPADRETYEQHMQWVQQRDPHTEETTTEFRIIARDGTEHWIQHICRPVYSADGAYLGRRVSNRDTTKQRQAQEALRESEEQYRAVFDNAGIGIDLLDRHGKIVKVNQALSHILGYTEEELCQNAFLDFTHPDDMEISKRNLEDLIRGEIDSYRLEKRYVKKDGSIVWVDLWSCAIRDVKGENVGTVAVIGDITERKEAEESLRKSEEKYRRLHETMMDAFVIVDMSGRIQETNQAYQAMLGYSEEELRRLTYADLTPADWHAFEARIVEEQIMVKGYSDVYQKEYRKKDGTIFPVELRTFLVRDNDGHPHSMWAIVRDITQRKLREKALRESEERYRSLFDNMLEGFAYCKMVFQDGRPQDFVYLMANDSFERLTGLKDVVGKKVTEVIPGIRESNPELFEIYGRVASTGSPEQFETYLDSLGIWFSISVYSTKPEYFVAVFDNVTERKRSEERLREYERVVEGLEEMVTVIDRDYRYVIANRMFLNYRGLEREQLVGRLVSEILDKEVFENVVKEKLDECFRGKAVKYEMTYNYPKFGARDLSISYLPIAGPAGVDRAACVLQDITERKRAEEDLRESQQKYRMIFEHAPLGILHCDRNGVMLDFNDKFVEMIGAPREQLIGFNMPERQKDERMRQALLDALEGKTSYYEGDYLSVLGDKLTSMRAFYSPVLTGDEKFLGAVGIFEDITERKQAEEALRESEERYRTVADFNYDWEYWIGTDGKLVYVSPSCERITGYSAQEFLDDSSLMERIIHPDDLGEAMNHFHVARKVDHEISYSVDFRIIHRDGQTRWINHACRPVYGKGGQSLGRRASNRDITERKRDVAERLQLSQQLLQAQKMEAVGILAGGVAHDFNNILTVVQGFSELLLMEMDEKALGYSDLQKIHEAGIRGADLVRNLLAFSRKADTNPSPINLNDEVARMEKLLSRTIPKMVKIELHLEGDLAAVNADPDQLGQVLMNLAVNSEHAMPDGGNLTIATSNISLDEEFCRSYPEMHPGNYVMLTVSDTGHGMDKETLQHIFEPFFTTKGVGKGTGLGLSMVYGIIRQHGGHIACYSEPSHGTTFKIYLPAVTIAETEREPEAEQALPRGGTETILLVDDENFIRDLGARFLTRAGYTVLNAASGPEAIKLYLREGERISLIILDLIMPEMGGDKCLEEILAINSEAKIVISSGAAVQGKKKETLESGAKGFVSKPFQLREMLKTVREVLDSA